MDITSIRFWFIATGLLAGLLGACDRNVWIATDAQGSQTASNVRLLARSGQNGPRQVAVDEDHVYWIYRGQAPLQCDSTVMRVPKTGGEPEVLASRQFEALDFVVDDNAVYWTVRGMSPGEGQLMRVAKTGGTPVTLVAHLYAPLGLTGDHEYLYWRDGTSVQRMRKPGGPPELVADVSTMGSSVYGIAVDEDQVYFGGRDHSVLAVPKTGGEPTFIGDAESVEIAFATDDSYVYWTGYKDRALMRAPKAGGPPIAIATESYARTVVSASDRIYFANNRAIRWIDRGGGEVHTLAETGGDGLAVDDAVVYFTKGGDGTVNTIAR
jgi:hypothetical protein